MTRITVILTAIFSLIGFTPLAAQDFEKGLSAAQAGDYATVLQEWKPLAEAGDAITQFGLGAMYWNGHGVTKDYAESARWFRLSAEQGYADAQHYLGVMLSKGQGVPQDYAEALKWYRLAAKQGFANAQSNLGVVYQLGHGVLQSNVMSHMWYNIASANGHSQAGDWRNEQAGQMTPADISKAQAMARECMSSGYKNCGY